MKETWTDYYEQGLDDGMDMFEAARYADTATRESTIGGIEAAEALLGGDR